jgi:hypothetical protein
MRTSNKAQLGVLVCSRQGVLLFGHWRVSRLDAGEKLQQEYQQCLQTSNSGQLMS